MAKKLYARVAYVEVYEDDYEEGEGKMTQSYDLPLNKGVFDTVEELRKEVAKYFLNEIKLVYSDDCGEFRTALSINEAGDTPTDEEVKAWRNGECKLLNMYISVPVYVVEFSHLEAENTEFGYFEVD